MSRRHVWSLICLCSLLPGCSFVYYGTRNLVLVPCQRVNLVLLDHKNHKRAVHAWELLEKNHPKGTFSEDYRKGFIAGYDDYLDDGGNGAPPPMPPWPYRQNKMKTPEGVQAAHQWFAGFTHGADEARSSGIRDSIVAPTTTLGPYRPPPPIRNPQPTNMFGPGNSGIYAPVPVEPNVLPQPRVIEDYP